MLPYSQSHSAFIFEETRALRSLSQTAWTRAGEQSHGGQRPNSCPYSPVHPQGCERGGSPGVWTHAVPSPTAAWQAPRGEGLEGSQDGLRSYCFWMGLWLKPGVCPNVRIIIVGGRAKRHAVLEQPFRLPASLAVFGGLWGAVPTGGGWAASFPVPLSAAALAGPHDTQLL